MAAVTSCENALQRIDFRADTRSYPVLCEHLSDIWLSTLEVSGAAQL